MSIPFPIYAKCLQVWAFGGSTWYGYGEMQAAELDAEDTAHPSNQHMIARKVASEI